MAGAFFCDAADAVQGGWEAALPLWDRLQQPGEDPGSPPGYSTSTPWERKAAAVSGSSALSEMTTSTSLKPA